MNVFLQIAFCILFGYTQDCTADCDDFRQQCTKFCLDRVGGVETNQCWGSPAYRYCTCSDNYIYFVPGYTCEHPTCPTANVKDGTTKAPIQRNGMGAGRKPLRRDPSPSVTNPNAEHETTPIITEGCKDFRAKCSALCNMEVENDQCWGFPKYRQCVCTDGFRPSIPGYPCEHPECPKDRLFG